MTTTYTAVATATGEGRNGGRTTTDDGLLDVTLAVPEELGGKGGATNPEQLFAVGWASCFLGAVKRAAAERKVRPADLAVVAEVTLHHDNDGQGDEFWLSGALNVEMSGVDQELAEEISRAAHQICPYSKATMGNIEVDITATVA